MTNLKPSTKNGARNLDDPSEPSPGNLQPAISREPAQPGAIRPAALINATRSLAPTKLSSVKGQPDSSGAPCAQTGCPGTIVDGYCDICGSPAPGNLQPAISR